MDKILIPPVFFFIAIGLIVGFYFWAPGLNWISYPFNLGGMLLIMVGFVVIGRARGLFARHETSLTFKRPTFFVREGVYTRTRNPIYVGMVLALFGLGICMRNGASIAVAIGFFAVMNWFIVAKEERIMTEVFGEEYVDYKKRVRRWI